MLSPLNTLHFGPLKVDKRRRSHKYSIFGTQNPIFDDYLRLPNWSKCRLLANVPSFGP